mmetsp:Transcript_16506/g.23465  ORF Transcript_16506/g.23465 Transcript_16506/m.23465 type:complete len:1122 (+) Transcript_16506:215-3580(+)
MIRIKMKKIYGPRNQRLTKAWTYFMTVILCTIFSWHWQLITVVNADPVSRAYVAYQTSPFDQHERKMNPNGTQNPLLKSKIRWNERNRPKSKIIQHDSGGPDGNENCPMAFRVGVTHRSRGGASDPLGSSSGGGFGSGSGSSSSILSAPVIFPIHPADGPGKEVLYLHSSEYLDMIQPSNDEDTLSSQNGRSMIMDDQYPLLFEGSSFARGASPIILDANADGVPDALFVDYDGGVTVVGLDYDTHYNDHSQQLSSNANPKKPTRYLLERQIPRLCMRKDWVDLFLNETLMDELYTTTTTSQKERSSLLNPLHTFFEYSTDTQDHGTIRGTSGNLLQLDVHVTADLEKRKNAVISDNSDNGQDMESNTLHSSRRRLEEITPTNSNEGEIVETVEHQNMDTLYYSAHNDIGPYDDDISMYYSHKDAYYQQFPDEEEETQIHDTQDSGQTLDAATKLEIENGEVEDNNNQDEIIDGDDFDYYRSYDDDYYFHSHQNADFYKDENYLHIPPHALSTPTHVEIPLSWKDPNPNKISRAFNEYVLIAVSYYLDEDEFDGFKRYKRFKNKSGGDDTEAERGKYLASALTIYNVEHGHISHKIHLDTSTDFSAPVDESWKNSSHTYNGMGAFALASPVAADVDGDGIMEAFIGTSMGIVHCVSLPYLYPSHGFPVQMMFPIDQPILLEDVFGDTNLEIFVIDNGGNVVCLDHKGNTHWHRDLLGSFERQNDNVEIRGTSAMVMGDIDGNGSPEIIISAKVKRKQQHLADTIRIFAIDAKTGDDISNFPRDISILSTNEANDNASRNYANDMMVVTPLLVDLHEHQNHWMARIRKNHENFKKGGKVNDIDYFNNVSRTKSKSTHGGKSIGLHIIQPILSDLHIIEGGSGCAQTLHVGDEVHAPVVVDDIHGTGALDLVIATASGEVMTLEVSDSVPFHPLNSKSSPTKAIHGYSASSGIFVLKHSRQYRNSLGVVTKVTFEIFDNRPGVQQEPSRKEYYIEMRDGVSSSRPIFQKKYNATGLYTENIHIPYGPGYYAISLILRTSHGLVFEDVFHLGYNINYADGLVMIFLIPLAIFIVPLFCFRKKSNWENDEDAGDGSREIGTLGKSLPTFQSKNNSSFFNILGRKI